MLFAAVHESASGTSRTFQPRTRLFAIGLTDGVIGQPACRSLVNVGAALQADGETRSAFAASSIRRRSVSHGPFCWTRCFSQVWHRALADLQRMKLCYSAAASSAPRSVFPWCD